MTDKTEALEAWKLMLCARMFLEPDTPDSEPICLTPDGRIKYCDSCRYF